ncbi:MAG: hypothetical protein JNL21_39000 [Myxococcales bacterium]|nr:hypothetical protein [Myxococcales bacterium]
MRSLLLALTLALGAPVVLGGCDKIKDLSGDKKASAEKDDDDRDTKKKKRKDDEKADAKSGTPASSGAPSSAPAMPVAAGAAASLKHMPAGCQVVLTLNASKVLAHPIVAKEIVPLIEQKLSAPPGSDEDVKKLQEFLKVTGLSLKGLHDGAFCGIGFSKGKGGDTWGLAIGADLKPDSIVPAFEKEGGATVLDVDGRKALQAKNGMVGGQFADGVAGLATNTDVFKKMNAASAPTYKVDAGRDFSFVVSEELIKTAIKDDKKTPEPMKAMNGASGFIDLGAGKAEVRLVTGSPEDAKKLDGLVALLLGEFAKDQKPGSLEEMLFKTVKTRMDGSDVVLELPIPEAMLSQAAAFVVAELKKMK